MIHNAIKSKIISILSIVVLVLNIELFAQVDYSKNVSNDTLYVWAANGVNVRKTPSPYGKIIKSLHYGTPVSTIKQEKLVAYNHTYSNTTDRSNTLTQISTNQSKVILEGYWLKVSTDSLEGYVFSEFILKYSPKKKHEYIVKYLKREFDLSIHKQKTDTLIDNCGYGLEKYAVTHHFYTSNKNDIVVDFEESSEYRCTLGSGINVLIPQMSFSEAFIIFTILMPPAEDYGFKYKRNSLWKYLIDGAGNTATLKKEKKGIRFRYFSGAA